MTLLLSERDVESLIDMKGVVASVEEAFRRQGLGEAFNVMRTRSKAPGSVLNVMHANLPYLHRSGLKAYVSTRVGTRFSLLLFDTSEPNLLAVMGADLIGRYRTGAASGVATKYMYGRPSGTVAVFGSGRQALTQVLALEAVMSLDGLKVWSPDEARRTAFALKLKENGIAAAVSDSPARAAEGVQIVSTITSSREPFLTERMLDSVSHANLAGGNVPEHAEMTAAAVGAFDTVVVDDIAQGQAEYGDLILASRAGTFSWESAVELASVVAGRSRAKGRTLFKSGGAALEDVAVASMLYDRAVESGRRYPVFESA